MVLQELHYHRGSMTNITSHSDCGINFIHAVKSISK